MNQNNKISISSSTKNLAKVRNFIESKAKSLGFDTGVINQIVISVDEACTNIIKHTHKFDENQLIEVENDYVKDKFVVTLKYKGEGFDPNSKENPDMKKYFKEYHVGGLGIPLMRRFMDKIEFDHVNPDINTLTLIKNIG